MANNENTEPSQENRVSDNDNNQAVIDEHNELQTDEAETLATDLNHGDASALDSDTDIETAAELKSQVESLEQQVAEHYNRYLAARAEADNIQKRAQRDIENAHKYALEKSLPDFLQIKDALELGTKAAIESQENQPQENALVKFIEGSQMAIKMFDDTFKKLGVTEINPINEAFKPEHHQAMSMIENDAVPPNHVIDVIQKGYTLNERLVRPAMVIVSKKPASTESQDKA